MTIVRSTPKGLDFIRAGITKAVSDLGQAHRTPRLMVGPSSRTTQPIDHANQSKLGHIGGTHKHFGSPRARPMGASTTELVWCSGEGKNITVALSRPVGQ